MPTIITLPSGVPGKPYFQCYSLTGKPKRLAMENFPSGVKVTLKGRQLCISADKFPEVGFDWAVDVLSCRTCDPLELVGSIGADTAECPCVPVAIPNDEVEWDDIRVGEYFEKYIPYDGSDVEFCADCLPDCLSACLVGRSVKLSGVLKQAVSEIRFALKNACTCECVEFSAQIIEPCAVATAVTTVQLECDGVPIPTPAPSPTPAPTPVPCAPGTSVTSATLTCT